jgi:hypothetical protein
MTFHRRYVLPCVAIWFVVALAGCNDEGKQKGGGGEGGKEGIQGTWVAGACNLPSTGNCTAANTCTPGSCNIGVSTDGSGGVNMTLNGQALTNPDKIVCTAQGAAITWTNAPPPGQHYSFLLDFGNVAPFTSSLTYGNGSDTQPATYTVAGANGCYKYNVKVCPIPANPGPTTLSCGEMDPKVIVGSGGTLTRNK